MRYIWLAFCKQLTPSQRIYVQPKHHTQLDKCIRLNDKLYIQFELTLIKKWRHVLVPTTPMTDIVPITVKYRPNCWITVFPADNICSMMGLLLSNSYVVPHWGHLRAFCAREAFPWEDCIHLSRHCSWATSVHVHGCFHFRCGSSGAKKEKMSYTFPFHSNFRCKKRETNDCQNVLPLCKYNKFWPVIDFWSVNGKEAGMCEIVYT